LLSTLLIEKTPDKYALPIKRNITDVSIPTLTLILNSTRALLVMFTLYFLRTTPFKKISHNLHRFWEWSYILLLIPLIFPHQQYYEFLFVCPAVFYIIYSLIINYPTYPVLKRNGLIFGLVLSYMLCNLNLIFGQYKDYYDHFKILTYGALLLIPMLASLKPDLMEGNKKKLYI
jgi:hypothetical protein